MNAQFLSKKNHNIIILMIAILLLNGMFCSDSATTGISNKTIPTPTKTRQTPVLTPSFTSTIKPTKTKKPTSSPMDTLTPTLTPITSFVLSTNTYSRRGPGMEFLSHELINANTTLEIYGRSEDRKWLLIDPNKYIWIQAIVMPKEFNIDTIPLAPTITPTLEPRDTLTSTPKPTNTPIPTNTSRPSKTPIPAVSIYTIYNNYKKMTALQFKEYQQQIAGKPVREIVEVGNVSEDGKIIINGPWSPFLFNFTDFCVVVNRVPKEFALSLNGGDEIYLEAKISGIIGNYNFYFNCENTLLLNFEYGRK